MISARYLKLFAILGGEAIPVRLLLTITFVNRRS